MITLTAKIDLLSGNAGTLTSASSNVSSNNISSEIGAILGVKKGGSNPFLLGSSPLGSGATLSSKVDYYIGTALSNENGDFSGYEFVVSSNSEITSLTIAFDTVNNKHPNKIYIDDIEYIDDDPIFTVANLQGATSHKISIVDWNAPNSPLVITGIYADITIEINHRNMISIERTIMDRGDIKNASWGIISNTGRIEFNDLDGEVQDYIKSELLVQGLSCVINLHDTLAKNYQQVAQMYTDTWDYDNLNRVVSVTIKDDLEEWQEILVSPILYNPKENEKKPFSYLYQYLYDKTPSKFAMLSLGELDERTRNLLENAYILYPILKTDNLWRMWEKMCIACQLYIYKESGRTKCYYDGGN